MWSLTDRILDDPASADFSVLRRHLAAGNEILAKEDLEELLLLPFHRLFPNRHRINRGVSDMLFDSRIGLFAAIGYNLDSLFPPTRSLRVADGPAAGDRAGDDLIEIQEAGLRESGLFDAATFSPDAPNLAELVRLIGDLRRAGAEVVIVVLPEMERLRLLDLPEPPRLLDAALRQAFASSAPPVLDLRDAIPDSMFYNLDHLNAAGRAAFTARLGQTLDACLIRSVPEARP